MIEEDKIFTDDFLVHSGFLDRNQNLKSFAFNSKVASVFDDMVSRSVPGYDFVQNLTADFISDCVVKNSVIYDLGCSTATTLIKLYNALKRKNNTEAVSLIGVDSSPYMLHRAQQKIDALGYTANIQLMSEDLNNISFDNVSCVISHYTLQFIDPKIRLPLLKKIYEGMNQNSYLIISEKVHFEDQEIQNFCTHKYYDFKRANGYSEIEIVRKREALENVLITYSEKENIGLLSSAGFTCVDVIHSELLFKTFLAKK